MSRKRVTKERRLFRRCAALALVFLTSATSFAQSLATVGENDALSVSVGYVSNTRVSGAVFVPGGFGANTLGSRVSGPTLGLGVSGAKLFELSGQVAWLDSANKPASIELGFFPHIMNQSGGFGVVSGLSFDLVAGQADPVFNLGGVFYVSEEFSVTYMSARFGVSHNETLGQTSSRDSFLSISFGFEFGLFSDQKASPFISLAGATAETSAATLFSATVGLRLPVTKRKTVKDASQGLPNEFD